MSGIDLSSHPVHLGLDATAVSQPKFTGDLQWYNDYVTRHADDGAEGRLVSMHAFTESWPMWEMHPKGAEVVVCTAGAMLLHQQAADGTVTTLSLGPGEYAINAPGVWHTADVPESASALFITAGLGTEHRPR